jgi:hypothetical protein
MVFLFKYLTYPAGILKRPLSNAVNPDVLFFKLTFNIRRPSLYLDKSFWLNTQTFFIGPSNFIYDMDNYYQTEMISSYGKPLVSANSCFVQDNEQELNADLFAVMWIRDHNKDAISHHMKVLLSGIRSCEPKPRQSFDEFQPGDG